jgi:hypothetical protein
VSATKALPRVEPCQVLGGYFPRDAIQATELRRRLVTAVHRYIFDIAALRVDNDKQLMRELTLVIRHSEALLKLLAEYDSDDRYGVVADGEAIGRPALQPLPRLLSPSRMLPSGVITKSRISSVRAKLQWLSCCALSSRSTLESDWAGRPKAKRKRGIQRGHQTLAVELAKECYQSLIAAGVPAQTQRQGRPVSTRQYVGIVDWALREGARRTRKGGSRVGDAKRIARMARELLTPAGPSRSSK